MATAVIMPKQGQSVESCILTEMKKKKGDAVTVGDVLFSYETDKASFEEVAQVTGTILEIFFAEGDEIPVLTNVLVIGSPGESITDFCPFDVKKDSSPSISADTHSISSVSPRAHVLAGQHAIRAETLTGTGPHGRVIERDVQAVIASRPKTTPLAKAAMKETGAHLPESGSGLAGTAKAADIGLNASSDASDSVIKPLLNIRKIIAKTMLASLQNSAQLTHHLGADARNILLLRKKVKIAMQNGFSTDITINDFVCFAVIKALKQYPNINAHFLGDSMRLFSNIHLAIAVDTERGLMVPTLRNADSFSLQGLSIQLKELTNACKKGGITPDLLSPEAASFTISNLGAYGVEIFTPIINLPQVAILGINAIVPRPKDLGDGVYGFVPYMGLSLTYDHRAIDGGEATRFLKQVALEIENLNRY